MNRLKLFEAWAPSHLPWSQWVKPALFAEMPEDELAPAETGLPEVRLRPDPVTALVIDLPGPDAVKLGLALVASGFQPVPLFNSAYHALGLVSVSDITRWLTYGVPHLTSAPVGARPLPAFLLDSTRMRSDRAPLPGEFDNRWMTFPQDFPSANFLLSQGLRRVLLVRQAGIRTPPQDDLAHVLLRWQEAGLEILSAVPPDLNCTEPLRVKPPALFRQLWQRALAVMGLRRNSAGGFGDVVPQPSSSSG